MSEIKKTRLQITRSSAVVFDAVRGATWSDLMARSKRKLVQKESFQETSFPLGKPSKLCFGSPEKVAGNLIVRDCTYIRTRARNGFLTFSLNEAMELQTITIASRYSQARAAIALVTEIEM